MKTTPSSPPQRQPTLAEEKNEFTSEGAPPPGVVGKDLPHPESSSPPTAQKTKDKNPHSTDS
jgi:hypothetical protein